MPLLIKESSALLEVTGGRKSLKQVKLHWRKKERYFAPVGRIFVIGFQEHGDMTRWHEQSLPDCCVAELNWAAACSVSVRREQKKAAVSLSAVRRFGCSVDVSLWIQTDINLPCCPLAFSEGTFMMDDLSPSLAHSHTRTPHSSHCLCPLRTYPYKRIRRLVMETQGTWSHNLLPDTFGSDQSLFGCLRGGGIWNVIGWWLGVLGWGWRGSMSDAEFICLTCWVQIHIVHRLRGEEPFVISCEGCCICDLFSSAAEIVLVHYTIIIASSVTQISSLPLLLALLHLPLPLLLLLLPLFFRRSHRIQMEGCRPYSVTTVYLISFNHSEAGWQTERGRERDRERERERERDTKREKRETER